MQALIQTPKLQTEHLTLSHLLTQASPLQRQESWMLELFFALVVLSVSAGFDGLSLPGYP